MRRDETSVTLEGNPLPQELDKITVIDRGNGRIDEALAEAKRRGAERDPGNAAGNIEYG
jgi:hypothetical protein